MPHRVLRNAPGVHELQQIIRAAGFGADAAHLEAAEGLAVDDGSGDLAVDVEIADAELTADAGDVGGAAGEQAAGEGVLGAVGDFESFVQILGLMTASTGPKISSWAMLGCRRHIGKDVRPDVSSPARPALPMSAA